MSDDGMCRETANYQRINLLALQPRFQVGDVCSTACEARHAESSCGSEALLGSLAAQIGVSVMAGRIPAAPASDRTSTEPLPSRCRDAVGGRLSLPDLEFGVGNHAAADRVDRWRARI